MWRRGAPTLPDAFAVRGRDTRRNNASELAHNPRQLMVAIAPFVASHRMERVPMLAGMVVSPGPRALHQLQPSGSGSTGRAYSPEPEPARRPPSPAASDPEHLKYRPIGHPSRHPGASYYVLPRSEALQAEETNLNNRALVILVVGTRPSFSLRHVRHFLLKNYNIMDDDFSLHRYHLEDFLAVFRDPVVLERVLHAPPLPRADIVLRFRRWQRFSSASADSMFFRVLVELRGIPAHAWSVESAWSALGAACTCPEPTPDTVARRDLRRFQAAVWCSDPDLIPNLSFLRIPEPLNPNFGAELYLRPDEIIHHQLRLLCYRIEIEILEIQDWRERSDGSSDPSVLPDRWRSDDDDEEDYPGYNDKSRSSPWPRKTVFRRLDNDDGSRSPSD
ncbi:hypothetical protein C2845_PM04G26310 [Panicum miliaceum]|uniref:DUF4283 domain-containing protein n=1 Tax=Panicum miliaceum TaxID=4540 RepID=A0A3L6QPD4_PANMI|nr:hypothetical protein C2845_PM04G26310 [Panicum miliaceum]